MIKEHASHWYRYPHKVLSDLPADRYQVVLFEDLIADPEAEVTRIYKNFGYEVSNEFQHILDEVTVESRNYTGFGNYSMDKMGVEIDSLKVEFAPDIKAYRNNVPVEEHAAVKAKG